MVGSTFISQLQTRLVSELETLLGPLTLTDIGAAAEVLEYHLCRYLESLIIRHCDILIPGSSVSQDGIGAIKANDQHIDVIVREALLVPGQIQIAIIVRGPGLSQTNLLSKTTSLEGVGRFSSVDIYLSPTVRADLDLLI